MKHSEEVQPSCFLAMAIYHSADRLIQIHTPPVGASCKYEHRSYLLEKDSVWDKSVRDLLQKPEYKGG
jgi:hypothetical protein